MFVLFFSERLQSEISDLRIQLEVVASQRDNALLQLADRQDEAEKANRSLLNLQQVLQHFQQGEKCYSNATQNLITRYYLAITVLEIKYVRKAL